MPLHRPSCSRSRNTRPNSLAHLHQPECKLSSACATARHFLVVFRSGSERIELHLVFRCVSSTIINWHCQRRRMEGEGRRAMSLRAGLWRDAAKAIAPVQRYATPAKRPYQALSGTLYWGYRRETLSGDQFREEASAHTLNRRRFPTGEFERRGNNW